MYVVACACMGPPAQGRYRAALLLAPGAASQPASQPEGMGTARHISFTALGKQ